MVRVIERHHSEGRLDALVEKDRLQMLLLGGQHALDRTWLPKPMLD